eukprot:g5101.t1
MGLEKDLPDGTHEDRSPQPSLVHRDRLASLRNDLLKRPGTFNNRISPARPPPDDAPILQARVSIPDSAPDRQQWVKQQSSSRRRRRRSSKSPAGSPQEGRGRSSSARNGSLESRPSSRDSSLGGGESDASSGSVDSRLSIASTPQATSGRQRQLERHQQHRRYGSSERTGPAGARADRGRRSSYGNSGSRGLSPSMLSSVVRGGGQAGGGGGGGSLSRNSSSSSLSTTVSSSSLGSLSLRWCAVCEAEFTRLRRPHRCRRCLEAVCAPCSPARLPVPGSGSLEPKRTCKLCSGRSARPQVDVVVAPRRQKVVDGSAGAQRRAASVGSMIRAPLGVFSGVAAAVKYTAGLYPATASSGAVNGAEDARKGLGGSDAGVGGGGKDGDAVGKSSYGETYFPTRIATGGLAALGRWRAGIGLSTEKPSEEPSASTPAARVLGDIARTLTSGGEASRELSGSGTGVAVDPSLEAAEDLPAASAPPVAGDVAEARAPASGEARIGSARPAVAVDPSMEAAGELMTARTPATEDEAADTRPPASEDETGAGVVRWPNVAAPLRRVGEQAVAPASTPAAVGVVAGAMAPASEGEAAETSSGVMAVESSRAPMRAVGTEVAEAKVPELEIDAEGGGVRADVGERSAGDADPLSTDAAIEDAWTMIEGDMAAEAPAETGSQVGERLGGPSVTVELEPEVVFAGGMSERPRQEVGGSRRAASAAAVEQHAAVEDKVEDAVGASAPEANISARDANAQAARRSQRTLPEAMTDDTTTSAHVEVVPSSPLQRALRFMRRLVQPHGERLRTPCDSLSRRREESVADLLPVLKAGSPIALECCAAFGIDAAGWMQTARIASESYRVVEQQAKKGLVRRRTRRLKQTGGSVGLPKTDHYADENVDKTRRWRAPRSSVEHVLLQRGARVRGAGKERNDSLPNPQHNTTAAIRVNMASSSDSPTPSWLVQEPEGHGAPKTPGRWKTMWASDCARLEEAHERGETEVLVYGRKYVVDMKERTVKPLFWDEEPASKPIIRATYFLQKGHGWLPYSEKDSALLEVAYGAAKVQLRSSNCNEAEVPLTDGENKVVMTKADNGKIADDYLADFEIALHQKPVKAPSLLATTFLATSVKVQRGSPEPGGWGGVLATEGDLPLEGEPPKHLVFVIHGIGESLWTRSSSVLTSLRASMDPMRAMSKELLESQRKAVELEEAASDAAAAVAAASAAAGAGTMPVAEAKGAETTYSDTDGGAKGARWKEEQVAEGKAGEGVEASPATEEGGGEGGGSGGYVEFLPVHGHDAVREGLMQDITLPSIPSFRDFANQAVMDVMYYLTPDMQASILSVVGNKMNEMWHNFSRFTPGFSGKVSIVGHSLGSIIVHDLLIAQPVKGETKLADGAVSEATPILSFYPEVLLACGSPIGMFLALRQSTLDKEKLFKFNTTKRFFNLFHLYDPVAYRLEPILDKRLRDLQPEHVPHRGGDRLHVSVKKFNRGVNEAIGRLQKSTGAGWHTIQNSIHTTIKSAIGDPGATTAAPIAREEVSDARDKLQERIDWVIQESTLEGIHPWASAVFAHSSYFTNFDMIMFLVNRLDEGLEEVEAEEEREGRQEGKAAEEAKATGESSGVAVEGLVVA